MLVFFSACTNRHKPCNWIGRFQFTTLTDADISTTTNESTQLTNRNENSLTPIGAERWHKWTDILSQLDDRGRQIHAALGRRGGWGVETGIAIVTNKAIATSSRRPERGLVEVSGTQDPSPFSHRLYGLRELAGTGPW